MDLRNCYGNINKHVFIQILNEDPELFTLASYVALVYARQSTIFFSLSKERGLLCALDVAENGAFQGEALAAFISCTVLNHVIRLSLVDFTNEEKAGICVASIIDDTTIHGTAPLLVKFFKNFNYNLLDLKTGIINTAKSSVIGPTESTSCPNLSVYQELAHNLTQMIHPGSPRDSPLAIKVSESGMVSLGVPHGSLLFKETVLKNKAEEINRLFILLRKIDHPQYELYILRTCLAPQ